MVFNAFVFCQIFNFINARKLNDEINIFAGILKNQMFIVIVSVIIALQVLKKLKKYNFYIILK